ncbi:MAG: hypothetical protein OEV08_01595 [Nitrospira sp.]|nr:hypothetical protein [Nitrospira sp.]
MYPISESVHQAWRTLLIESEFARNYPIAYQLYAGMAVRNPVLNEILESRLADTDTSPPKNYRPILEGGNSPFHNSKQIANGADLHTIRPRRGNVVHDASTISWNQLDQGLTTIHATLQHLGIVRPHHHFEVKAERSAMLSSQEPDITGSSTNPYASRKAIKQRLASSDALRSTVIRIKNPLRQTRPNAWTVNVAKRAIQHLAAWTGLLIR